jgi:hypothetical protein
MRPRCACWGHSDITSWSEGGAECGLLGFFTGVLTLVPYHHWQLSHARHHATSGNLDKRG